MASLRVASKTTGLPIGEMQVCSYMMNGAVSGYSTGPRPYTTYKLTQFQSHYMLYWEADENSPDNYDNVASKPDEGVTKAAQYRQRDGHVRRSDRIHQIQGICPRGRHRRLPRR